jgi:hypothetical protein
MQTAKLECWSVVCYLPPYQAPEQGIGLLRGIVFNHPKKKDREVILTSTVKGKRENKIVTCNTVYELGEVNPQYEEKFPNAFERVLKCLPEI